MKNYVLGLLSGIVSVILLKPLIEVLQQWLEYQKSIPTLKILRANAEINNLMSLQEVQLRELEEAYIRDYSNDEEEEEWLYDSFDVRRNKCLYFSVVYTS